MTAETIDVCTAHPYIGLAVLIATPVFCMLMLAFIGETPKM